MSTPHPPHHDSEPTQKLGHQPPPQPPWATPGGGMSAPQVPSAGGARRRWVPWAAAAALFLVGVGIGSAGAEDTAALTEANERVARLETRNDDLSGQLEQAQAREADLDARETELDKREGALDERESTLDAAEKSPPAPAGDGTGAGPAATFVLPNEVGKNLQVAQDDLQEAAGDPLFVSFSEDATGAGRGQMIDSGWLVCSQEPSAGTRVGLYDDVTLYVVRVTETCP